jgi:ribosomal protein S18 acetylase RimI-like enzyme
MAPEISIAPLELHEVEALCGLAREIWRAHYPPIIGTAQTEYMLAQRYQPSIIGAELGREDIFWDVLRLDGVIVAFASSLVENAGELKLDKLYVHPSRQRCGYGGLLMDHTCARARALGLAAVTLAVNKHNQAAIASYRKHGFEIRDAVVKDIGGGFVMDDYVMVRPCRAPSEG